MAIVIQETAYKLKVKNSCPHFWHNQRINKACTCCIWITTYYEHEMQCRLCARATTSANSLWPDRNVYHKGLKNTVDGSTVDKIPSFFSSPHFVSKLVLDMLTIPFLPSIFSYVNSEIMLQHFLIMLFKTMYWH
jgi:hypothetical protein